MSRCARASKQARTWPFSPKEKQALPCPTFAHLSLLLLATSLFFPPLLPQAKASTLSPAGLFLLQAQASTSGTHGPGSPGEEGLEGSSADNSESGLQNSHQANLEGSLEDRPEDRSEDRSEMTFQDVSEHSSADNSEDDSEITSQDPSEHNSEDSSADSSEIRSEDHKSDHSPDQPRLSPPPPSEIEAISAPDPSFKAEQGAHTARSPGNAPQTPTESLPLEAKPSENGLRPGALLGRTPAPSPGEGLAPYFGRRIEAVLIQGAGAEADLSDKIGIAPGQRLRRAALRDAVEALYRSGRFVRVAAKVRESAPGEPDSPVELIFQVEAVQRIARTGLVGIRALDESMLRKAIGLAPGSEFWPESVQQAAQRLVESAWRAGYRQAQVRWDATPSGDSGKELSIDFSISEGDPTLIRELGFSGNTGLALSELQTTLTLPKNAPLSLGELEQNTQALLQKLRQEGFYRARVQRPKIEVHKRRATVDIPIEAGPHFTFYTRGNRSFSEKLLLEQLNYRGEEALDPLMQRELAERLRKFYELAGHAQVKVLVRESLLSPSDSGEKSAGTAANKRQSQVETALSLHERQPRSSDTRHQTSEERSLTFVISEGPRFHVIQRQFEGVHSFDIAELNRRIDVVLEDAIPPILLGRRDEALLKASFVSSAPDSPDSEHKQPRVRPREVYAEAPYKAAAEQIADLYRSEGFLEAVVGPVQLEILDDNKARVVVPVKEGPRTLISRIEFRSEDEIDELVLGGAMRVRACDPLSFFAVEESRSAALSQLLARGHFYASVEAADEPSDEVSSTPCKAKNGEDINLSAVVFHVNPGPIVRVKRVEVRGAVRTQASLVEDALALSEGMPITPHGRQQSVRNLMRLGLFNSASVDPAEPDRVEAEKTLVVEVREKPRLAAELRFGASLADGPRISGQLVRSYLGGKNRSFTANAKLNWPMFRLFSEQQDCLREQQLAGALGGEAACKLPSDPIERRINLGFLLPQIRAQGGKVVELRTEAVHENLQRPSYQLTRFALLGAADGLLQAQLGLYDFSALLEAEIEHATYASRQATRWLPETMADLLARRMPEGTVLLASLRPTVTLDGRDDKFNPTRGIVASLSMDFARSLFASEPTEDGSQPFEVSLIRALMSARGYIPLGGDGKVVLALAGNLGTVFKQSESRVIGTKRFFLGGTASLRGFNEDAVVPEEERVRLHEARELCESGQLLPDGALPCDAPVLQSLASGNFRSEGGELLASGRAELRMMLAGALGAGFFLDAGNLWLAPSSLSLLQLRYAAGAGLRFALPIGPAAFDVGVNLNPDLVFDEPRFRIHLSVGLF